MNGYLVVGLISFVLSSLLTALALMGARSLHLLPAIRTRDVHEVRKPRVGGVAMLLTVLIVLLLLAQGYLGLGTSVLRLPNESLLGILTGLGVLFAVGLLDDIRGVSPWGQLAGQAAAGLCLVAGGAGVEYIRLPWGSTLFFTGIAGQLPEFLGGQTVYLWSALFTVTWVVMIINVINWFDGLDGLAGSIALTGSVALLFVSLRLGVDASAILAVILAGTILGFLPWNWNPSKLFMGTVGSQLLGFMLAATAIISGGKVATAVLVLGIPLFDAGSVIIRRLRDGVSPFQADQRHLHHRLLNLGLTVPQVVVTIALMSTGLSILAYRAQQSSQKAWLMLAVVALMALVIFATYRLEQIKKAFTRS